MLPKRLYHAAGALFTELKPGYMVTKKLVKWDYGETNRFLYAVEDKNDVIVLGFASAIEKLWLIDRFQWRDTKLIVHISEGEDPPTLEKLAAMDLYVYTIKPGPEQLWVKNNNKHNGLDNEWKTKSKIPKSYFTVEKIDVKKWMKDFEVEFIIP